jgi:hypothetical protein
VAGAMVFCEGKKWQLLFLELSFFFSVLLSFGVTSLSGK